MSNLRERLDEARAFIAAVEGCEDIVDTLTEAIDRFDAAPVEKWRLK